MTNQAKLSLVRWIAILLVILGLRFVGGGRAWEYMVNHLLLTILLPFVALFLVLFVRGRAIHNRRQRDEGAKVEGAQSAKL